MDPEQFTFAAKKSSPAEWVRGGSFGIQIECHLFQILSRAECSAFTKLQTNYRYNIEELTERWDKSSPSLHQTDLLSLITYVLSSVEALHDSGICGLDFRCNRVYCTSVGAVMSKRDDIEINGMMERSDSTEAIRFLLYCAPEVIRGIGKEDKTALKLSDIWSFGCLCLYILSRRDPQYCAIDGRGERCLLNKHRNPVTSITIMVGNGHVRPEYSEHESDLALYNLLSGCFELIPELRASTDCLRKMLNESQLRNWKNSLDQSTLTAPLTTTETCPVYPRPFVIKLRSGHLLPQHADSEKEDIDVSWSNSASCAVRLLAHFQAPKLITADAEKLIHKCPKAVDPGRTLQKKYCEVLKELVPELRIKNAFMLQMACALLDNEQMLAGFTTGLQPVGAPFPELVEWMNTFETDYEYTVKEDATWNDIQAELEAGRPVMVMIQSGDYKIRPHIQQLLQADGIPACVPALHVTLVHGYTGSTEESRILFCTSGNGIGKEWAYSEFMQCWEWTLDDWRIEKIFECAQARKRSMVFRREKSNNVLSSDNSAAVPDDSATTKPYRQVSCPMRR